MPGIDESIAFIPVRIAVMTVSDTRTEEDDHSGGTLVELLRRDGHRLIHKVIVKDEAQAIVDQLGEWIADPGVDGEHVGPCGQVENTVLNDRCRPRRCAALESCHPGTAEPIDRVDSDVGEG